MTDKVREAVDKVRELSGDITDVLNGGVPHDSTTYRGSLLWDLMDAAIVLQEACLAERPPADDGEAVTEEWLKAVGFKPEDGDPSSDAWLIIDNGTLEVTRGNTSWMLCEKNDTEIVTLPDMPTRSHVRRLCQSIGIQLKEAT